EGGGGGWGVGGGRGGGGGVFAEKPPPGGLFVGARGVPEKHWGRGICGSATRSHISPAGGGRRPDEAGALCLSCG
ncbi:MAG: hypothetical protein MPJ22_11810, partial [Pirellulales bacterium]|nr:hypothetical protein [Pirellulales bacterium]